MSDDVTIAARAAEESPPETGSGGAVAARQRRGVSASIVSDDSAAPRRRGRKPGTPKTGGRKPGSRNLVSSELRLMILNRGRPFELLADVCRGLKIRVGPQAGPGEPEFVYPSLGERIEAAKILAKKLLPDLANQELTGADGGPIGIAASPVDDAELARRLALVLSMAGRDGAAPAGGGGNSGADRGYGATGAATDVGSVPSHNFSHADETASPEFFSRDSAASLTADASAGLESREGVSSSAASIAALGPAVFSDDDKPKEPTAPPRDHLLRFRGLTVCILNCGPLRPGVLDDFFEARAGHVDWRAPGQVVASGRFEACLKTVRVLASRAGVTELRFDVEPISRNPILMPGGGSR